MTKLAVTLSLLLAACGGARPINATPAQRAAALQLYATGSSPGEVALELAMEPDDAREVIHAGIVELNRRYYRRGR